MFQTFISRHNSNFFSDKLVLTSVTPASSAPVLQTPKATSSTLYFDRDRKSGSAGMPRPISYAVFCLKKKNCSDNPPHRSDSSLDGMRCTLRLRHHPITFKNVSCL